MSVAYWLPLTLEISQIFIFIISMFSVSSVVDWFSSWLCDSANGATKACPQLCSVLFSFTHFYFTTSFHFHFSPEVPLLLFIFPTLPPLTFKY